MKQSIFGGLVGGAIVIVFISITGASTQNRKIFKNLEVTNNLVIKGKGGSCVIDVSGETASILLMDKNHKGRFHLMGSHIGNTMVTYDELGNRRIIIHQSDDGDPSIKFYDRDNKLSWKTP